jgi:hypothetical protein
MKEKLRLKINLLLNDLKISEANEKKNSRYTFNHQLFAERVKELKKILEEQEDEQMEAVRV